MRSCAGRPSLPSPAMRGRWGGGKGKHEAVAREAGFDTRSVMAMQGLKPTMGERNERRAALRWCYWSPPA